MNPKCFLNRTSAFLCGIDRNAAIIIIFTSLLFLFNLGKRDLWAPDEPRYAQVAKEMWESKDFILPRHNSEKYPDKPPVLFWLIILFSIPFGEVTELSARLPSALAGIGCVITTYYLARKIFSNLPSAISHIINPQRIALLAALILATSIEYLTVSRRASFDGLLTFLVTLSLFCFYTGYLRREKNTRLFLLSYLFMAIAALTKGPVGFAIPILVISAFLCILRFRYRQTGFCLSDMRIGWGAAIVFLIPLLWVFGIYVQGGWEHMKEVVFTQNIGRTVDSWSHKQPFYYFLHQFPLEFMPWSIFIPGVIIYLLRLRKHSISQLAVGRWQLAGNNGLNSLNSLSGQLADTSIQYPASSIRYPQSSPQLAVGNNQHPTPIHNSQFTIHNSQPIFLFPAIWFTITFIFFSIMSGKRQAYILPLYPAASLFVAWFLDSFISSEKKMFKWTGSLPLQISYVILIVMGIAFSVAAYYYYNANFVSTLPMSIIFVCGQIIALRFLFSGKLVKALTSSFIVLLITVMLGTQVVIPIINQKKSARHFCEKINQIIGADGEFASFGFLRSAYLFYTGKNKIEVISDMELLDEYLSSDERVYLLLRGVDLDVVKKEATAEVYVLVKEHIGHRSMVLISNRPEIGQITPLSGK